MCKYIFILLSLLILSAVALGDVITFKDGRKLEGEIVSESKDSIRLKMKLGEIDIKRVEIKSIERKKLEEPKEPEPQDTESDAEKEAKMAKGRIKRLWKKFYQKWLYMDKKYVRLPDFDLKYESSNKRTKSDFNKWWKEHFKGKYYFDGKNRKYRPSTKEDRKKYLQRVFVKKVGDFGVDASIRKVFQVLKDDEMILLRPRISPQSDSHGFPISSGRKELYIRVKGFSTKGLTDGEYWDEQPIAVISTWQYTTVTGASKTILNAIPLKQVRDGLTEEQFAELLKQKGITESNVLEVTKGKKDAELVKLIEDGLKSETDGQTTTQPKTQPSKSIQPKPADLQDTLGFSVVSKKDIGGGMVRVDVKITNLTAKHIKRAQASCILKNAQGREVAFAKHYVVKALDGGLRSGETTRFSYVIDADWTKVDTVNFKVESVDWQ